MDATQFDILAYNENHDEVGRFAESDGAGGGASGGGGDFAARNGLDTFKKSLSETESEAATSYQGPLFDRFNSTLRGVDNFGDPDSVMHPIMERIKTLDKVMAKAPPLKEPVMVFRTIKDPAIYDRIKPGAAFSDKAFVSTTFDKSFAKKSVEKIPLARMLRDARKGKSPTSDVRPGQMILAIRLPAGTKGLSMKGSSDGAMDHQQEFVLPRGAQFKIASVKDRPDGVRLALLDFVGSPKNPEAPTYRGENEPASEYAKRRGIKASSDDRGDPEKFSWTDANQVVFDDDDGDEEETTGRIKARIEANFAASAVPSIVRDGESTARTWMGMAEFLLQAGESLDVSRFVLAKLDEQAAEADYVEAEQETWERTGFSKRYLARINADRILDAALKVDAALGASQLGASIDREALRGEVEPFVRDERINAAARDVFRRALDYIDGDSGIG